MYHYVRPREGLDGQGVRGLTVEAFAEQLDELTRTLEPLHWADVPAWFRGGKPIPSRTFLLTFDDGLKDHVEWVLPALERRGLRGIFFVSGMPLAERRMLDAHAIHLLLSKMGEANLRESLLAWLNEQEPQTPWWQRVDESAATRRWHYEPRSLAMLKHLLMITLSASLRRKALDALVERHVGASRTWAERWYLNADEVKAIHERGHTIGIHGYSHEPLATLSADEQRHDLARTVEWLDGRLGPGVRPVSYPYGSYNDQTVSACADLGLPHAFTTERRWVTNACHPLRIPRVDAKDVLAELREHVRCG